MSFFTLSDRCRKIVQFLLFRTDYTSTGQLAKKTGVSGRSIYYDICNINEWLDKNGIEELEVVRGKGILIPVENKKKITELLSAKHSDAGFVFLPSDRVKIMICYIIQSETPVYIDQLIELCQVSRNTIFGDLRVLVNKIHEYDLSLKYESKKGYCIEGDEIRKRALFFLYSNELKPLFDSGVVSITHNPEVEMYEQIIRDLKAELRVSFVEGSLFALPILLPNMKKNRTKLLFPGLRRVEIEKTREYHLVRRYFADFPEWEITYLCLLLLGTRLSSPAEEIFENRANQSVYGITKALVVEFEKIACVEFENREELERSLFVHINSSLYRYQYGIQIGNPMREDIIREYHSVFEITKTVCKYLEQMIGLPIPDGEVAYLALHFGSHLRISKEKGERLRILIVCVNGISTGNMLKREVKKLLPEADIVGVVAAVDAQNLQNICDLIICTVPVKSVVPVVYVHPILTSEDRYNLLNHQLVCASQREQVKERLFEHLKKYVKQTDYSALRQEISYCLEYNGNESNKKIYQNGLLSVLSKEKITIQMKAVNWHDSIRRAGQCLVDNQSIEPRYIESIISQTMYYGTYMFLNEEVMLAHARTEDGVKKLDVSLSILKEPVFFSAGKKARMILVLGTVDQEMHLEILSDIMKLMEKNQYKQLLEANSAEKILQRIEEIIEEV